MGIPNKFRDQDLAEKTKEGVPMGQEEKQETKIPSKSRKEGMSQKKKFQLHPLSELLLGVEFKQG